MIWTFLGALVLCYLIGGLPFGFWFAKAKGIDITKEGSGNIGATNVGRLLGKPAAITVFLLDVLKGLGPALLGRFAFGTLEPFASVAEPALIFGLAAVVGHSASPFLGFKGGKGVATGLGMVFGAVPIAAALAFGVFFLGFFGTRIVSLASILGALTVPFTSWWLGEPIRVLIALSGVALFVVVRHKANIGRILKGEEKRFEFRKKAATEPDQPS